MAIDKRNNPEGRKYQIQKLWAIHHEICRLAILGMKQIDIARVLGITEATVSTCLNSAVVKQQLHVLRMARDSSVVDVAKRIEAMAPKAAETMDAVLSGDTDANTRLKVDVAKDILDRAGHAAVKTIKGEFAHAFLTIEDIEDIKRKARENKAIAVEATVVE